MGCYWYGIITALLFIMQRPAPAEISRRNFKSTRLSWEANSSVPKIIIGTALTLSHDAKFATLSGHYKNSYEFYLDWLNTERGGVSIHGVKHRIELVLVDDESNKTKVRQITEYLADDIGVDLFLAPYSSGLTDIAADVVASRGKTLVSAGAAVTTVFQDRDQAFGLFPPTSAYLTTSFKSLSLVSGGVPLKVAYITEDVIFPKSICSAVERHCADYNMQLVHNVTVPDNAGRDAMRGVIAE
jgi:ABC-type branched-subunit amino acid transport system substrate-binding protein